MYVTKMLFLCLQVWIMLGGLIGLKVFENLGNLDLVETKNGL